MAIKRILLPFCEAEGLVFVAEAAFKIGRSLSAQVRGLFAQPSEGLLLLPERSLARVCCCFRTKAHLPR